MRKISKEKKIHHIKNVYGTRKQQLYASLQVSSKVRIEQSINSLNQVSQLKETT